MKNNEVRLTPKEFELLLYLARHAGRVVTHRALLLAIWGPNSVEQPEHLRVLVAQLRKKIDAEDTPRYIITEPWVGYRFEPAGESLTFLCHCETEEVAPGCPAERSCLVCSAARTSGEQISLRPEGGCPHVVPSLRGGLTPACFNAINRLFTNFLCTSYTNFTVKTYPMLLRDQQCFTWRQFESCDRG